MKNILDCQDTIFLTEAGCWSKFKDIFFFNLFTRLKTTLGGGRVKSNQLRGTRNFLLKNEDI